MSATTHKCPNCGGALAFDIGKQTSACRFCGGEFAIDAVLEREKTAEAASPPAVTLEEFGDGSMAYSCPSCGGRIVADATTAATFCVFCGNPALIADRLSGNLRPTRVIPFKLDREAALREYRNYCKMPLIPKSFRDKEHVEQMRGLYVPYWLFSCTCRAEATLRCEKRTSWSDTSHNHTKTAVYEAKRSGEFVFSRIPADGSAKLNDELTRAIEPFDYRQLVPFDMQFLSGHLAESYDVPADRVEPDARRRVREGAEAAFKRSVSGYSSVAVERYDHAVSDLRAEYVMAPIWILVSKHKGKEYVFAMNAQTGKVAGRPPLSLGRFFACWGGVAAGVAAGISAIVGLAVSL